jgi:hypothetical protein
MEVMKVNEDRDEIRFLPEDQGALTSRLCALLKAVVENRRFLIWVERVDISSPEGSFPLFHDEDGSSRIDLHHLPQAQRERLIAALQAGF